MALRDASDTAEDVGRPGFGIHGGKPGGDDSWYERQVGQSAYLTQL